MKKDNRLKKNEEFQKVFQQGTSVANRQFVVYSLFKKDQDTLRIGLSVSKKIGNAVARNKVKRYIREGMREFIPQMKPDRDLIIIARQPVVGMGVDEVRRSLHHVLQRGKLLPPKSRQHQSKDDAK
ncbi:ribonuclease P protein component [Evansella caseinilytica]|uniref:Ribonuclease P protein component n=1 Tax=Evansella caseinilytica TaxID=1503961 RepID=A0A1H3URQ6_9BACI|nr:ribonuclease P protein component [Evansella caseinilytica]SDZ65074.1 ribonuclease P protein component [Evansella caseinilytica]